MYLQSYIVLTLFTYIFILIRLDIFHCFLAIDGGVPGDGYTYERLEAGPTVRRGPDDLVLDIHRVRVTLRAQRLRRDESPSMPQQVLNATKRLIRFRPFCFAQTRNDRSEQKSSSSPPDWIADDDARARS